MVDELVENVEGTLLSHFAWNPWFLSHYWPENRSRVLRVLTDTAVFCPPGLERQVLDVGCFNGYVSAAFALSGYSVTAVDAHDDDRRRALFDTVGRVTYREINLNGEDLFGGWPDGVFDVAFMGEVIEHILNSPLQLLVEVKRLLKPGGRLYLTTPNPSTLMNAWRVITGRYAPWGTRAFATQPKIARGRVIANPDIHYREYTREELQALLREAGFAILVTGFIMVGSSRQEVAIKRWAKAVLRATLGQRRLLSSCQYVVCEKPFMPLKPQGTTTRNNSSEPRG
jgi:SAM-dependent methyltransferase